MSLAVPKLIAAVVIVVLSSFAFGNLLIRPFIRSVTYKFGRPAFFFLVDLGLSLLPLAR